MFFSLMLLRMKLSSTDLRLLIAVACVVRTKRFLLLRINHPEICRNVVLLRAERTKRASFFEVHSRMTSIAESPSLSS